MPSLSKISRASSNRSQQPQQHDSMPAVKKAPKTTAAKPRPRRSKSFDISVVPVTVSGAASSATTPSTPQTAMSTPGGSASSTPKRKQRTRRKPAAAKRDAVPQPNANERVVDLTADDSASDSGIEIVDGPSSAGPSSRKPSPPASAPPPIPPPPKSAPPAAAAKKDNGKGKGRASPVEAKEGDVASPPPSYHPLAFTPFRPMTLGVEVDAEDDEEGEIVEDNLPTGGDVPSIMDDPFLSKIISGEETKDRENKAAEANDDVEEDDHNEAANASVLLLPDHIKIATGHHAEGEDGEVSSEESDEPMDDVEGVYTVDDDKARGVQRYYMEKDADVAAFLAEADQSKICRKCKRPGHKEFQCPHIICTTCGVEDQHERRDCPFTLLCFGCGQRGHKKQDCPDPVARRSRTTGCDRCGVWDHTENSCPLIWRVYVYRSKSERVHVVEAKESATGWEREAVGGRADDRWCYNCAQEGHLGDDCKQRRGSLARAAVNSAFSDHMASLGPFGDMGWRGGRSTGTPSGTHMRWDDKLPHVASGFQGANAGQKSREKERERARQRDRDDWRRDEQPPARYGANFNDHYGNAHNRNNNNNNNRNNDRYRDRSYNNSPRYDSDRGSGGGPRGRRQPDVDDWFDSDRRDDRRPWDSERRRPRSPVGGSRNGRNLDYSEPRRDRSRSPDRRGGGGGGSGSGTGGAKGVVFGKMSMPPPLAARISSPSVTDSPSVGRSRGGPGGGGAPLLKSVLGGKGTASASNRASGSGSPGPSNSSSSDKPLGKKAAKRARDNEDRDWETTWRMSGAGGGNVARWGDEMDREERGARRDQGRGVRDDRVKAGPTRGNNAGNSGKAGGGKGGNSNNNARPASKGQRYTGGY